MRTLEVMRRKDGEEEHGSFLPSSMWCRHSVGGPCSSFFRRRVCDAKTSAMKARGKQHVPILSVPSSTSKEASYPLFHMEQPAPHLQPEAEDSSDLAALHSK